MNCNAPNLITQDVVAALAETLIKRQKYQAPKNPATKALEMSNDPVSRARALLIFATIEIGLSNSIKTESFLKEALLLQPEGELNMKARLLMQSMMDHSS